MELSSQHHAQFEKWPLGLLRIMLLFSIENILLLYKAFLLHIFAPKSALLRSDLHYAAAFPLGFYRSYYLDAFQEKDDLVERTLDCHNDGKPINHLEFYHNEVDRKNDEQTFCAFLFQGLAGAISHDQKTCRVIQSKSSNRLFSGLASRIFPLWFLLVSFSAFLPISRFALRAFDRGRRFALNPLVKALEALEFFHARSMTMSTLSGNHL